MDEAKDRTCLRCSRTFFSNGPSNRICDKCARKNADVQIPDEIMQGMRGGKYQNGHSTESGEDINVEVAD